MSLIDITTGRRDRRPTAPSYHDLHITAPGIERTSIFDLPYTYEVRCLRTSGWELWYHDTRRTHREPVLIAGEYDGPEQWLILDVDGHVIVNSRDRADRGDDE
jgi:hypothetical protein